MSEVSAYDVMRRIDRCKREENKMYMRFLFEADARGIEGAGHLTSTDRKRHTEAYGPIGKDCWLDEVEAPDMTNKEVIKIFLDLMVGLVSKKDPAELVVDLKKTIDKLSVKIPVGVFKVNIAKQHLEEGEGYPYRYVALPLDKRYDPWAEDLINWFHDKGNNVAFDLNRQDNWEYITRKDKIFDGLFYTIKKYHYSVITGEVTEDKCCLEHPRLFKGHGIRHARTDYLIQYLKFDGYDLGAMVGWSMGSARQVSASPTQATNYADLRKAWRRYMPKLLVPFNYGALQA
jgi:hypothetical protein